MAEVVSLKECSGKRELGGAPGGQVGTVDHVVTQRPLKDFGF